MNEEEKQMEEDWDPEEAKNRIGSLKVPVEFKLDDIDKVDLKMEFVPKDTKPEDKIPRAKVTDTRRKKNKNELF